MDKRQKRAAAENVAKAFSKFIAELGFRRTKTSFWTRPNGFTVQFVHLHLFSYAPAYRVHLGIRVLNDSFAAVALNGFGSHDGWYDPRDKYFFEFDTSSSAIKRCAESLSLFCHEIAEPWFRRFADSASLLSGESPLDQEQKDWLRSAIEGKEEIINIDRSKKLLGLRGSSE